MKLHSLSDQELRALARQYELPLADEFDRNRLIEQLSQLLPADNSGFISQSPKQEDNSGFISQTPKQEDSSGFISQTPKQEDSSGFISQTPKQEDSSGFISQTPKQEDSSGFISQTPKQEDSSGFISQPPKQEDGSGFISQTPKQEGGSGFLSQTPKQEDSSSILLGDSGGSNPLTNTTDQIFGEEPVSNEKSRVHNLGAGDQIELAGASYLISKIISQSSGEAVIYQLQDHEGNPLVLKLYFQHNNPQQEPNAVALRRIQEINNPDILNLHGFGTGDRKYQEKYCYEISDLAAGGNLFDVADFKQKYQPDFLLKHVIPEVFLGIQALHKGRIYHCDLKPQNIFYLDAGQSDLVIGDYGSAKTFDVESEQEAKQFSTVIGTNAYLPPEQARGIISEKNDYYSFGMVLLHLLYPQYFAKEEDVRRVDMKKFRKIIENQFSRKAIVPFDPAYKDLNQLIEGLTLYDSQDRWGATEIAQWQAGKRVSVKYSAGEEIKAIKLGYAKITYPEDLLNVIEQHPRRWYGDIIGDRHGYDALLSWLASYMNISAKRAFEKMIAEYKPEGAPYVKEAIFRFFEPEKPVYVADKAFSFAESDDLKRELRSFFESLDAASKANALVKVRYTVFQFEFALRQASQGASVSDRDLIQKVLSSMATKAKQSFDPDFASYQTQLFKAIPLSEKKAVEGHKILLHWWYLTQKDRVFRDLENRPIEKLEDLGLFFAADRERYNHPVLDLERRFYLSKLKQPALAKARYDQFLFVVFKDATQTHLTLEKLRINQDREYHLSFRYQQSLVEFFQEKKMEDPLRESVEQTATFVQKKHFFQLPGSVFQKFLEDLETNYKVPEQVLSSENLTSFRRKFTLQAISQHLKWGLGEWLGSLILVFPILLLAGFVLLGLGSGDGILAQYLQLTNLDDYIRDGEKYFNQVSGFYLVPMFFFGWYVLALIARLWAGKQLQLFGKVGLNSSPLFSIRGANVLGYLAILVTLPVFFTAVNWLYEILGVALMVAAALFLIGINAGRSQDKERRQNKRGRSKWHLAMIVLVLTGTGRLLLEIFSWSKGGVDWEKALAGRSFIEIGGYLLIALLFFALPIVSQLFSAHNLPRFSLKALVWAALGVFFAVSPVKIDSFQKANWAKSPPQLEEFSSLFSNGPREREVDPSAEIPYVFLAQISDGFEAINIREGQGTDTDILGLVKANELFLVQSDPTNGWWSITTADGRTGYMHNSKINKRRPARESDLPDFPTFEQLESSQVNSPLSAVPRPTPSQRSEPQAATPAVRIAKRDVERLLNKVADPNNSRSVRQQAVDQLMPLFINPKAPVIQRTTQGRRRSGYKEIKSYLLELKLTGNHKISIVEFQQENGKINSLEVSQKRR